MKIGIDAIIFQNRNISGIRRSVWEIINFWADKYREYEYYLFSKDEIFLPGKLPDNWHLVTAPARGAGLWNITILPRLLRENKIDVFWGTYFSVPLGFYPSRTIMTVYDMFWYKYPKLAPDRNIRRKILNRFSCRKAEKIVTISNSAKKDIQEAYNIPDNKVIVSYCGGPSQKKAEQQKEQDPIQLTEGIEKDWYRKLQDSRFFLYLGNIEPRKNLSTLIRAYELYCQNDNDTDQSREYISTKDSEAANRLMDARPLLVIAGKRGWKCEDVYRAAEISQNKDDIIFTDYVTETERNWLLSHAAVFVFPSLYEGFGIPVLEAYSWHLPVVTCAVASLPEVAGKAAFYIEDPYDVKGLAREMKHAAQLTAEMNFELEKYRKEQLNRFSWEKNANEMMRIIREVYEL